MSTPGSAKILLVCSVGGSPEPIVASISHWRPLRVGFVATAQSRAAIESEIAPKAGALGFDLDPGRYDTIVLDDGQDLARAVENLRRLEPEVEAWLDRGADFQVVVDFTGGTKCMSVALALLARRWRCVYSYIGGDARTKDGLGVVVSGSERPVHQANPWDALGFQAVEQFVALFDQRCFKAAAELAGEAMLKLSAARKREFNALKLLAEAYDLWDRFQHRDSANKFDQLLNSHNDLRQLFPGPRAEKLIAAVKADRERVASIDPQAPGPLQVVDLLANARRRFEEGRFDDAVGRLYRCVELIAQIRLAEAHDIPGTGDVTADKLPKPLREKWRDRLDKPPLKLGLQDAYELLTHLDDPVGRRFNDLGLADPKKSPLVARNGSILAHGLQPVSGKVFGSLFDAAKQLGTVVDPPEFPRLSS